MDRKETGLSAGRLAMMALGSVIGGSFFLGSAVAINAAGPAIIISYILGGVLVFFILYALSEMTVANPDMGSFRTFAADSFGPGAGFVVGWVYWTGMVLSMSSEATAVAILVRKWYPGISVPVLGASIIIGVTIINLLGADKLSRLESALSLVKLSAMVFFIILAVLLITGLFMGRLPVTGETVWGSFAPGGIRGIAGSMLIVIFSYAGFEVIGLAASEARNPHRTVPKAIFYTVVSLVGLYVLAFIVLLPLIPSPRLDEDISPMVAALQGQGMQWAGNIMGAVLVAAILSTMLAAMFGLGRMMRSLADEGDAPGWLRDKQDVPYRGIIFSGFGMLAGLGLGLLLPRVYLFLISAGGFALLFTYASILAAHIRFRKKYGCPPEGKCQMPGYPYTSWFALVSMIAIIISMPFIPGQTYGLLAGLAMLILYSGLYAIKKYVNNTYKRIADIEFDYYKYRSRFSEEISEELIKGLKELDELERYKDDELERYKDDKPERYKDDELERYKDDKPEKHEDK